MVRPMTNWRAMMRMAWTIAWRMTGSPLFATRWRSAVGGSADEPSSRFMTRPVSMSAHVDALTKTDWL